MISFATRNLGGFMHRFSITALAIAGGLAATASPASAQSITFTIEPAANGRAWYIKEWFFSRCARERRDPWNPATCRGWQPITSGVPTPGAVGLLCIRAEWGRQGIFQGSLNVLPRQSISYPIKPIGRGTCP